MVYAKVGAPECEAEIRKLQQKLKEKLVFRDIGIILCRNSTDIGTDSRSEIDINASI